MSIIICSRKSKIAEGLVVNIHDTIGVEHEIILIDNSENEYSIYEAYNKGLDSSIGDVVIFLHEDVIFHNNEWGKKLFTVFENYPKVGLVGIAGGKVKTKMPSGWWHGNENVLFLIQHFKERSSKLWNNGFGNEPYVEVAAIDGVFMAMKKEEEIRFDERLKGFHHYDSYLSLMHHNLGNKVLVTNQILLEHFSQGSMDKSWCLGAIDFHKLYKNHLPIVVNTEKKDLIRQEFKAGANFVTLLFENKIYRDALYWWFKVFRIKPISGFHLKTFRKLIESLI